MLVALTSTTDSIRVLDELGADTQHRSTFTRCLQRISTSAYQAIIARKCFEWGTRARLRTAIVHWVEDLSTEVPTATFW